MTIGLIWLALIILMPIIGFYLLRINASPVFLSLCLGYVLFAFDAHSTSGIISSLNSQSSVPVHLNASATVINFVLLLGPAALIIITQLRSIHASKRLLNLLPSIAVGLFASLLIVPLLPSQTSHMVTQTIFWTTIIHNQSYIVGLGSIVSILLLRLTEQRFRGKKHHSATNK